MMFAFKSRRFAVRATVELGSIAANAALAAAFSLNLPRRILVSAAGTAPASKTSPAELTFNFWRAVFVPEKIERQRMRIYFKKDNQQSQESVSWCHGQKNVKVMSI
jgi:hypothetical protein